MTFLNTCNTGNHSTIQLPHKPGAIQDTPLLPPARIGQNSAESLCHPGNGDVPFRVIRIKETGVEDGRMCRLSNILGSADRGFQATVEDESVGRKTMMRLEIPGGERRLDVDAVKHNLGAGRYKAKTFRDHEGEHVCQLKENVGLRGGMHRFRPQGKVQKIITQLKQSGVYKLVLLAEEIERGEPIKNCFADHLSKEAGLLIIKAMQLGLMPGLQLLRLSNNTSGEEGVRALSEALQKSCVPGLQSLDLSNNNLGAEGARALIKALQKGCLPDLQSLDLSNNKWTSVAPSLVGVLGAEGARALSEALQKGCLPSLKSLDLSNNNLGAEGARALSEALQKGCLPSLQSLDLSDNNLGAEGARALSNAWQKGCLPDLKELRLNNNNLGAEGARALSEALQKDCLLGLQSLGLSKNNLGAEGMLALSEALQKGCLPSLQWLNLIDNNLNAIGVHGLSGVHALSEALHKGCLPNLVSLGLGQRDVGNIGLKLDEQKMLARAIIAAGLRELDLYAHTYYDDDIFYHINRLVFEAKWHDPNFPTSPIVADVIRQRQQTSSSPLGSSAAARPSGVHAAQPSSSVQNSDASHLQEAQVWKSVGVTQEQLKLWVEKGQLFEDQPKLEHPHNNEKVTKEIRRDIADKIIELNKRTGNETLILKGIDLPSALQQIAHAVAGDNVWVGFIPPEGFQNFTLQSRDKCSRGLVFFAALHGYSDAIRALKELGANVNTPNNNGCTPVWIAAENGHSDTVRILNELGANINTPNNNGCTPVWSAAYNGHSDTIRVLNELGANVNTPNKSGYTPAYIAYGRGHFETVRTLNELNESEDKKPFRESVGVTSKELECWAKEGWLSEDQPKLKHPHNNEKITKEIRRDIADKIIELNKRTGNKTLILKGIDLPSALWQIAHAVAGDNGCLGFIPPEGFQNFTLQSRDKYSKGLVFFAALHGYSDAIRALKELGANVNTPNNNGCTPVWIAAENGHSDTVRVLNELGANINTPNNNGCTPVWGAAYNGHSDTIRVLNELGANINKPNNNGYTPADIANGRGHIETVRTLNELDESEDKKPLESAPDMALIQASNSSQIPEDIHNQDALQVINDDKQLTLENLKTWVDKTQNAKDALLAIQAVRVAGSNGHIKIKNNDGTPNVEVQNEVSAILTAAQTNVVDNIKDPQEQEQQLRLIEHMARLCLGDTVGLLSNTQYWNLAALIKHTIKIEHLHAKINETQEQMKNINTQFQKHIFNVQELAQAFQENLDNLKTNQQDIADKIIEIGKRMRNIRIASAIINTAQTVINFIPFAGPIISSLGGAAYNASVATQAHDVLVGLHEFKAGLVSAAASLPDAKDLTLGDIITETQGTSFGQLKLNTVLDSIQEQYIYHQLGKLEKELRKPLPEPVLVKPQLTAGSDKIQDQQDNVSAPVASSSNQSSEETIPDADPHLAVTLEDTQENQSMLDDDADSVASSGMKTEDEHDHRNIVMSAVKHNSDPDFFSKLLKKNSEKLNHVVTNRKGTSSSAFDFSGHYGRPELAQLLMDENVQSARNNIPFRVLEAADKNIGKYDDEGRRKQP